MLFRKKKKVIPEKKGQKDAHNIRKSKTVS